jgi:transcriptional regulator NrdR family protein
MVANSRHQTRNNQIWRRRRCLRCKAVFTTHEAIDLSSTLLVKPAVGPSKPFLTDFLYTELLWALSHHKQPYTAAREVTSTVIMQLLKLQQGSITTTDISQATSQVLKRFDKQAWLRYQAEHPSLQ